MQQPFFTERPNVQIDAVERPKRTHRIGPIFQDPRRPDCVRRLRIFSQRPFGYVVIKLLVILLATSKVFLTPAACMFQTVL